MNGKMGRWGAQDGILRLGSHKMPSALRILWDMERVLINPTYSKRRRAARPPGETLVRRRRSRDSPHRRAAEPQGAPIPIISHLLIATMRVATKRLRRLR